MNNDIKKLNDAKKRYEELIKLSEQAEWSNDDSLSKEDKKAIKSALEEVKNMEKSKLQSCARDLAKKIRDYSNDNK
jgi:hypothetical protein